MGQVVSHDYKIDQICYFALKTSGIIMLLPYDVWTVLFPPGFIYLEKRINKLLNYGEYLLGVIASPTAHSDAEITMVLKTGFKGLS